MNVPEVKALAQYFQDTWINGPFPVPMWNVVDANLRTNNRVDGWHTKLNRTVRFHHLNAFQLVDVLKEKAGSSRINGDESAAWS